MRPIDEPIPRIPLESKDGKLLSETDRITGFLQSLNETFHQNVKFSGWACNFFRNDLILISAVNGIVTFEFTVTPELSNRMGNLHGGAAATIFDMCTTCALSSIAKPGFWSYGGVSRTLSVTFLRPAPIGMKVLVQCEVVHAGKTLCTIKGVMREKTDGVEGKVLSICEHGKVGIDPPVKKDAKL